MQRIIRLLAIIMSLAIGALTPFLPVPAVAGDQADEMAGSIDITSIVNFNAYGTKLAEAIPQAGTIVSIGDNPSVVISSRSQAPSNDWERYRMESSPQDRKGGIMSSGVMAAFRIPI